jgi:hypothetical protein
MPSITSWSRLEPHARKRDLRHGLQAAVHDPLWLLARQWQVGEFAGEDAGSPVSARTEVERASITRIALGPDGAAQDFSGDVPLDVAVERESRSADNGLTWQDRVDAGLTLLRVLESRGVPRDIRAALVKAAPLSLPVDSVLATFDDATRRFLRLTAGRVPDGVALLKEARAASSGAAPLAIPRRWEIPHTISAAVATAVAQWLTLMDQTLAYAAGDESSWIPQRLEHDFRIAARAASAEVVLHAREFNGGPIDWHTFDLATGASLGATTPPGPETEIAFPAPATFRGMPAARFWEFEDARIDLGNIDTEPEDLPRLLLIEFAVSYGNDWFVIPVDVPCGALARIHSFEVTDAFGIRTSLPHYAQTTQNRTWLMWTLGTATSPADAHNTLFLPPVTARTLDSAAVEDVSFVRDEVANIAWAIEHITMSDAGTPVDRAASMHVADAEQPAGSSLRYQLAVGPPGNWFPFVPQRGTSQEIRLTRGAMALPSSIERQPDGVVLGDPARPTRWLYEEEVPRAGVRVIRRFRYSRWIDGSAHLWIGKRKIPSSGGGSSGLRFDRV